MEGPRLVEVGGVLVVGARPSGLVEGPLADHAAVDLLVVRLAARRLFGGVLEFARLERGLAISRLAVVVSDLHGLLVFLLLGRSLLGGYNLIGSSVGSLGSGRNALLLVLILLRGAVRLMVHVEEALLNFGFLVLSIVSDGVIQIFVCLGTDILESSLGIDNELVELYLLDFLLLDHKLSLIIRQLLTEPLKLFFEVLSHFL